MPFQCWSRNKKGRNKLRKIIAQFIMVWIFSRYFSVWILITAMILLETTINLPIQVGTLSWENATFVAAHVNSKSNKYLIKKIPWLKNSMGSRSTNKTQILAPASCIKCKNLRQKLFHDFHFFLDFDGLCGDGTTCWRRENIFPSKLLSFLCFHWIQLNCKM